jgi:hypothetical protein
LPSVLFTEGNEVNEEGGEMCLRFLKVLLGALVEVWLRKNLPKAIPSDSSVSWLDPG